MNKKLRFSLLSMLVMLCGTMFGGSITFSELGLENGVQYSDPFDGGDFTVQFAGGQNDGKYYTTGAGIRVYGNGTMTIAAKAGNLTKIVITFAEGYNPSDGSVVNGGTYNAETGEWTGSTSTVTFTRPSGSGHWRVQKIEATVDGEVTPVNPSITPKYGTIWSDGANYGNEGGYFALPTAWFKNFAQVGDKMEITVNAYEEENGTRGPLRTNKNPSAIQLFASDAEGAQPFKTWSLGGRQVVEEQQVVTFTLDAEDLAILNAAERENIFVRGVNVNIVKIELVEKSIELPTVANIAAFKALNDGDEATLTLTDAFVTAVSGSNAYVQDATGALYFYNTGLELTAGTKLNGSVTGKFTVYNNLPEFAKTANTNGDNFTATEGTAEPKEIAVADVLDAANISMLVALKGVDIIAEEGKYYVMAGETKVQIYDQFRVLAEDFQYPAKADMTVIIGMYRGNVQLYPIDANSIQEKTEPLFADGKYYLYNIAAGKYWGAGNNWGTQASLLEHPEYVTLHALEDGLYTLESQVSNGGTDYYFNGDFMDNGSPVSLTITKVAALGQAASGDPVYSYTIANGDNYFGWDGQSTVLGKNLAADSENALWVIASHEQVLATLAEATASDPIDATFLIADHDFGRNNRSYGEWTFEASNKNNAGDNTNFCVESYHALFNMSQTLADAPKGIYALTAQGFYRQDGEDNEHLPVFFANDETKVFPLKTGNENSMTDASHSFTSGLYTIDPIYVEVAEGGTLTIGAKLEENTNLWCIWDNFVLTYYGANASMDEVQNSAILTKLADLRDKASELKDQVDVEAVKTAIDNVLDETANVSGADAINEAIVKLKDVIEKAEASVMAKNVLPKMKELVDGTNVYTEEALNEYYTQWAAKYESGELTKVEAANLQDPTVVTGWHAAITCDNFLLSAWDTNPDFVDAPYYINTWSVEGDSDGSNFRVPFFEYWTNDDKSLDEKTLTATMNNLEEGDYEVTAWVRVRMKNGAEAPTYGITLSVNDGEAVNVADGTQVGTSQMFLKDAMATGKVGADGVLKIQFIVAADNNISWLSFKNVKFAKKDASDIEISELKANNQNAVIYNLAGQKVQNATKGLYIINGKKVVK